MSRRVGLLEELKMLDVNNQLTHEKHVEVLYKHDAVYHFDDSANSILDGHSDIFLFNEEESKFLDMVRDRFYSQNICLCGEALKYEWNPMTKTYEKVG